MQPLKDFIDKHLISINSTKIRQNPFNTEWKEADHWEVQLTIYPYRQNISERQMITYFSQGYGHNGKRPKVESVLECLRMDADVLNYSFEDWCYNLGFDTDSREALKTYEYCLEQSNKFKDFLGNLFDDFMNEVDFE